MVIIEPIENSKENLAPSVRGYDIGLLLSNGELAPVDSFENELARIERLRHKHCQSTKSSEVIEAMANCIERFKVSEDFKNSVPFVKLCLDYGAYSDSPATVFDFMESNGIGMKSTERIIRKANFLETRNRYVEAQAVLKQGLTLGAEPRSALYLELSDLQRRHNFDKPQALRSRVPIIDISKRRKLAVYVDDQDSAEGTSSITSDVPSSVPQITTENKENKQAAEPLIVSRSSVRSSRRIEVYFDDNEEADVPPSLSYNEQAILYCNFPGPVRKFEPGIKRAMEIHRLESLVRPSMAEMYQQHSGVTEPIGNALLQKCGDTEVLR